MSKAAEDPLVIHLTEVLDQCASRKETSQADIFVRYMGTYCLIQLFSFFVKICPHKQKSINSLSNIPASELLLTHVSYYQKIREM